MALGVIRAFEMQTMGHSISLSLTFVMESGTGWVIFRHVNETVLDQSQLSAAVKGPR